MCAARRYEGDYRSAFFHGPGADQPVDAVALLIGEGIEIPLSGLMPGLLPVKPTPQDARKRLGLPNGISAERP